MNRFLKIGLASLFVGCGPTEESAGPKGPDHRVIDMGADLAESDVSEDMARSDMTAPHKSECSVLAMNDCFIRPDCAWTGATCRELVGSPLDPFVSPSSISSGVITLTDADGAEDHPARIMLLHVGDAVHGSLSISQDSGDQVFPFRGGSDSGNGRIDLRALVPHCLVESDASCDVTVPALEFTGSFVDEQWIFPAPRLAEGFSNPPLSIQNLRFQPNDGIKPSRVRGTGFVAQIFSIFQGEPLDAVAACDVSFTGALEKTDIEFSSFLCGQQDLKIVDGSFALVDGRVWFQFETNHDPITFIGWDDGHDIGGVLVRDQNRYYRRDKQPITAGEVDIEDIVGSLMLQPGGPTVR